MPAPAPCVPCCTTPQVTNIPGPPGIGTAGVNGINAFTLTTSDVTVPALNATVNIPVINSSWMGVGQIVLLGQGVGTVIALPGPATFQVTAIPSASNFTGKYLGYPGDVASGFVIGSGTNTGGAIVTPSSQGYTAPVGIINGGTGQTTAAAAAKALNARRQVFKFAGLNFNVTTDQALNGFPTKYIVRSVTAVNASISLTTAAGGIYTAAAKGGTVVVPAAQVYTALTAASKWKDLTIDATGGGPTTDVLVATTLYLSLTTGQGAAATADVYIEFEDLT